MLNQSWVNKKVLGSDMEFWWWDEKVKNER